MAYSSLHANGNNYLDEFDSHVEGPVRKKCFWTGKMGFGSLGLGVKVTKMRNTSAIVKAVMFGHFLSSMAKIKGMKRVWYRACARLGNS